MENRANTYRPDPFGVVIFGVTGDLAARKLVPALFDLDHLQRLPQNYFVLGTGRRPSSDDDLRAKMRKAVQENARFRPARDDWDRFAPRLHYFQQNSSDVESYQRLAGRLRELDHLHGTAGNYIFYLSVPPELYPEIVENLGAAGHARQEEDRWRRVVIEKPFGRDAASARALNGRVRRHFDEEQVYRIDHYLGKETVQNLAVFRFANGIFEPIWNRNFIDHVQITVAETLGVEHRAGFYEGAGAVRDMVQNHLLQLLCLVAMEPPAAFEATPVQREKLKVLQCLRPLTARPLEEVVVRGQYGPGRINGLEVPGYRQEPGISDNSVTETFAALRFELDSWRWAGVPFYLRTGKRLPRKSSQVSIQFRDAPLHLFACTPMKPCEPNQLTLRIQPDEGIALRFIAKEPGLQVVGRAVEMDFSYRDSFTEDVPDAYETLLLDCLRGDRMLFARGDWIEASWEVLDPLLQAWAATAPRNFPNYPAGTWGPDDARALLERGSRQWHLA